MKGRIHNPTFPLPLAIVTWLVCYPSAFTSPALVKKRPYSCATQGWDGSRIKFNLKNKEPFLPQGCSAHPHRLRKGWEFWQPDSQGGCIWVLVWLSLDMLVMQVPESLSSRLSLWETTHLIPSIRAKPHVGRGNMGEGRSWETRWNFCLLFRPSHSLIYSVPALKPHLFAIKRLSK